MLLPGCSCVPAKCAFLPALRHDCNLPAWLQCGMVPVGLRFAHGFNYANSGLGLPCPEEAANGWVDLSETL